MAIRLFSTLCILILIAKPSGTPIGGDLEAVNSIRRASLAKQTEDAKPEDTWKPEMPMTWLVRDTRAFGVDGKTSLADHPVDLRLTYHEWVAIYFDALGLDKGGYEEEVAKRASEGNKVPTFLTELDEEIPGFPLLSRIRGPYHDVVFERDELEDRRKECLKVQAITSNTLALQGLEKLIHVYDQARRLGLSIYFGSN